MPNTDTIQSLVDLIESTVARAESLGSRITNAGVRLIGHVPQNGPEAYFHVLFPGLKEREIARLEREIGRPVVEPYRGFLKCFNGASFFGYSLALNGLRFDYRREGDASWQPFHMDTSNVGERPRSLATDDMAFGNYEYDGSVIYLRGADNAVVRCDRRSGEPFDVWSDFGTFLKSELSRLSMIFDSDGHRIGSEIATLPSAMMSQ